MNKASGGDGIPVELFQPKRWCCESADSIGQKIWKTQQWPQDWKRSIFIPIPKKGNARECSNYHTIALTSRASKVMLKILQARLQQYVNHELPDVQAGFKKGRRTRDQIANICWIIKKVREFQKNIYFCLIDYVKAFDCVDHNKLWKILKEMGVPNHLTCLLRNLYAGQEATVRTGHGTTVTHFILGAPKSLQMVIAAMKLKDTYSLEEKLLTILDSILKSRDITLPAKVHLLKAMVFPVVIFGCESWTIKKTEHQRIDAFELWCWRRLLRVPWTARRSNQS